ncbi:hypothetical protein [Agitococcus lubricus]|uniref:Uncharacterized protein n=1 Tax=Agitococcus lubricus TaxID=1077255 RepID=A0A2T5IT92_9GAMM|nr:hypothetical protein [Agitococcus lubricus]PTQ87063.1 hypothetical protein C8N29_1258 [Agitococcus lubricus]
MNKYLSSPFLRSEKTIALNTSPVEDFNKISTIALPISLLASCQPSYVEVGKSLFGSNSDFLPQLNKISYLSPLTVSKEKDFLIYLLFSIDLIVVTGNNLKQELQNLFTTVQHHTIVGVFLCLSFSNLPIFGKLCFALALVYLWWGGRGNKPFGANTVCRRCNGSEPPCRPTFRVNNTNIHTLQKGTTI